MAKVSVIIPTYQRVAFLKDTLDSVVSQTFKDIEIIVVDDGSPNNDTQRLCQQYNNIQYIKITNSGGPATPRNVGLELASGEYIAFLDDDDIWVPNKIEEQVKILDNNQDFGLVHCYCKVIDQNGKPTEAIIGKPGTPYVKHGDVHLRMIGNWTLMMPTPLIRRSVLDKVGKFNTAIPAALEDVEFWTRCSFYTKFYYIDKPLALYRVHESNISSNKKKYVDMPLYLKAILKIPEIRVKLNTSTYRLLLNNVCRSQAKFIKHSPLKTLYNLFRINPFWLFNLPVLRLITKKVIAG